MTTNAKIVISAEDKASAVLRNVRSSVDQSVASFATLTGAIGALGVGGAVAAFKQMVGALDDLAESAQGVGVSAQALADLRQAAVFAGVDSEKLDKALGGLANRLDDAAKGGSESAAIFKRLGISVKDAQGNLRGTDDVLGDIADRFSTYRDGAEKTALASAIFGDKLGRVLIPYLNQGSAALKENTGRTAEAVKAAEELQKAFDRSAANLTRFKNALVADVAPAVARFLDDIERGTRIFGGFGNALLEAGLKVNPFKSLQGNIEATAAEIERLRKEQDRFLNEYGEDTDAGQTRKALQVEIDLLDRRLAYLKETQRARALEGSGGILDARDARAAVDGRGRPPGGGGGAAKDEISDAQRALAQYVAGLERERDVLEEIGEKEKVLQLLRANPSIDTPQVRELLFAEAERVELARQKKALDAEADRLMKSQLATENELRDTVLNLAGVGEEERKRKLAEQLEILIQQGRVTQEQALRVVKAIAGTKDEIEKARDVANEFAMVFTSSIGQLIEGGGNAKSFIEALSQDILKLTTRLLILEPIAAKLKELFKGFGSDGGSLVDSFTSFLGSVFGGARAMGGPVSAGRAYLVGERGPELFMPGSSGRVIANGAGGAVININMAAGSNVDRSTASQIGAAVARQLSIANRRYN
jgi:hypothetical protein